MQKPVLVGSFTGIDEAFINRLNAADIMNSKEYWERNQTATDELFCLCDLVRINGVGPVAARMFYETGYQSVEDVAAGDAALMLKKISDCNATQQFYKSKLGIKDMQFCIDFAKLLS